MKGITEAGRNYSQTQGRERAPISKGQITVTSMTTMECLLAALVNCRKILLITWAAEGDHPNLGWFACLGLPHTKKKLPLCYCLIAQHVVGHKCSIKET